MQNTQSFLNPIIATNVRAVNNLGFTVSPDIANSDLAILNTATMVSLPTSFGGGIMYGLVPTNGNGDLTWTRGSDAWRTNRERLVQRTPWNLIQYSEQFDNAYWGKTNVTITTNATTAPNGTTTADKIVATATSANHFTNTGVVANGICTVSVYAKASEYQFVRVQELNSGKYNSAFDLSTGVASQGAAGTTASIQSVGNGWYRCIITFDSGGTNLAVGFVGIPTLTTGVNYTGNGTSGVFIWGAQLVEGTLPQPYLPTTDRLNVPRIDYSQGTACMLLEPQRTNTETYSEDFSNAAWSKTNCSITANATTSPDGTTNASKIIENSVNGVHFVFNATATLSVAQTLSVYAKADTRTQIALQLGASSVFYNLSDGTIVSGSGGTITSVGNGWYRCVITQTPANTNVLIYTANSGSSSYQGNGTSGLYIYGAQLEVGAFSTTYIKTTTATVTRIADSFSRNNIYTNNLISASGGTWFVEFQNNVDYTRDGSGDRGLFLDTSNTGNTNGFQFVHRGGVGTQRIIINKRISGSDILLYLSSTTIVKFAIKWNGSTADIFANGTKVISGTAFAITAMEFLNFISDGAPFYVQQMALWNTPLSDLQCASLTSDVTDGFATASLYNGYVNQIGGVIENTNGLINNIQNFK